MIPLERSRTQVMFLAHDFTSFVTDHLPGVPRHGLRQFLVDDTVRLLHCLLASFEAILDRDLQALLVATLWIACEKYGLVCGVLKPLAAEDRYVNQSTLH